jgi:hypothetical protein
LYVECIIRIIVAILKSQGSSTCKASFFDDVVANLELLDEEFYNNSTYILQILGNNLSHWNLSSDMDVDAGNNNHIVVFVNVILHTIFSSLCSLASILYQWFLKVRKMHAAFKPIFYR